ncbi:GDSL esterase/lipase [Forsythia ovata]|uniref:GDSL esterase/lipase n=1 Tax=Forsythia ovata TaxID=205694 RepID=A0ABD1WUF7_9LAMI
MESQCSPSIVLLIICTILIGFSWIGAMAKPQFTAMYVFGDSLSDPGNNLYFHLTATKSNYFPYGIDFHDGPTGRFCNGKLIVDFLAELVGLPILPAYENPSTNGENILFGVNYASSAAGILDESGSNFGHRFPLSEQIQNFKNTLNQLRNQMEEDEISKYLANALVLMAIGSNDYINNYLMPQIFKSSHLYSPGDFADLLIKQYAGYLLELHNLGLRKFYLVGNPPCGCTPFQLSIGHAPPGQCISSSNNIVEMFNSRLKSLVLRLNSNFQDSQFVFGPSFQWFFELRDNPFAYGLKVTDKGCCSYGPKNLELLCLPSQIPCANRDQYLFWDSAHPTQAVNQIIAQWAYNGSFSNAYPRNIQQMAQM